MTWLLVSTSPSALITMPVPAAVSLLYCSASPEKLARDRIAAAIAGSGAGPRTVTEERLDEPASAKAEPARQRAANEPGTRSRRSLLPGSGRLAGKAAVVTGAT